MGLLGFIRFIGFSYSLLVDKFINSKAQILIPQQEHRDTDSSRAPFLLFFFSKQEHRDTDSSRTTFGRKVLGPYALCDRDPRQDSPNHALPRCSGAKRDRCRPRGIEINIILYVGTVCVSVCVCV